MKFTGRIVITVVTVAIIGLVRIYGVLYYDFPVFHLPIIGVLSVAVFWWLGSQYDKVRFYAEKDVLTELCNRRYVIRRFPKLLANTGKKGQTLTLLLLDVDDFKQINDRHGHETGDRVLQSIARILAANASKKDIAARWAGDEFLIISPCSGEKAGEEAMKRIQSALRALSEQSKMNVSVSVGASVYPHDAATLDGLLNAADRNMYIMKSRQNEGA